MEESHPHDIEGIGSEKWPVFLERNLVDDIITVSDVDGFNNVRQLAQREGLLVGSSSEQRYRCFGNKTTTR